MFQRYMRADPMNGLFISQNNSKLKSYYDVTR